METLEIVLHSEYHGNIIVELYEVIDDYSDDYVIPAGKNMYLMIIRIHLSFFVINMVDFIYEHCEKYLYEEHKHSTIQTGIKQNDIVSIDSKLQVLSEIKYTYQRYFYALKTNPYAKLTEIEKIDTFNKLQSISPNTIQYMTQHIDQLEPVNYNTGIKSNQQFYQPKSTLIKSTSYSKDIYENQVIVGFLRTVIRDLKEMKNQIQKLIYNHQLGKEQDNYIDSTYYIFTRSINALKNYLKKVSYFYDSFKLIYHNYSKAFGIKGNDLNNLPKFTSIFRALMPYRQIYQTIYKWFSCGNYDLGRNELLLSFISTSKIYEYYCLIKLLLYLDNNTNQKYRYISAKSFSYETKNRYYRNTRYNNTFYFESDKGEIVVYFQPIIYGNHQRYNDINLYRNTSSCFYNENRLKKDNIYAPDYLIKQCYDNKTEYIILDAKFSKPENVRKYSLPETVYKYLFSISTLQENDVIDGLYLLCGKSQKDDYTDIVNDISASMNRTVTPFVKLLIIGGKNTDNTDALNTLFENI